MEGFYTCAAESNIYSKILLFMNVDFSFSIIYFDLYLRASALKKIPGWKHQSFGFFPLCNMS